MSEFEQYAPADDCHRMLERLYAFHDHALPEAEMDEIRQHLLACEPCLDHYEVEDALRVVIRRGFAGEHAPAVLRERIHLAFLTITERRDV